MLAYFLQSTPLNGIVPTLWIRKQRLRETETSGLSESRVCSGFTLPISWEKWWERVRGGQSAEVKLAGDGYLGLSLP